MAPLTQLFGIGLLPLAAAHMQLSSPSPLRDPHAQRPGEQQDWNMLDPLASDGSNFPCKGYHLNTPLNSVKTYEAGRSYDISLGGSAMHGGGSCQISLSCDGGAEFRVLSSIIGDCPMDKNYRFDVPEELECRQGLLAWTWFNKIGNREMYMNCAVVDIVPRRGAKRPSRSTSRTAMSANIASQMALRSYPELFVANLKNINDCVVKETVDVVFDDPGRRVAYGNAASRNAKPSFGRGQCRARRGKAASFGKQGGRPARPPSSQYQYQPKQPSGQWTPPNSKPGKSVNCNDGQWHPMGCWGMPEPLKQGQWKPDDGQWRKGPHGWKIRKEAGMRVLRDKRWDAYKRENSAVPSGYSQPGLYDPGSYALPAQYAPSYGASEYVAPAPAYILPAPYTAPPVSSVPLPPPPLEYPPSPPIEKPYNEMTEAEKFEAFLRRLFELSNNIASVIKYAVTPARYDPNSGVPIGDEDEDTHIWEPSKGEKHGIIKRHGGWGWPWTHLLPNIWAPAPVPVPVIEPGITEPGFESDGSDFDNSGIVVDVSLPGDMPKTPEKWGWDGTGLPGWLDWFHAGDKVGVDQPLAAGLDPGLLPGLTASGLPGDDSLGGVLNGDALGDVMSGNVLGDDSLPTAAFYSGTPTDDTPGLELFPGLTAGSAPTDGLSEDGQFSDIPASILPGIIPEVLPTDVFPPYVLPDTLVLPTDTPNFYLFPELATGSSPSDGLSKDVLPEDILEGSLPTKTPVLSLFPGFTASSSLPLGLPEDTLSSDDLSTDEAGLHLWPIPTDFPKEIFPTNLTPLPTPTSQPTPTFPTPLPPFLDLAPTPTWDFVYPLPPLPSIQAVDMPDLPLPPLPTPGLITIDGATGEADDETAGLLDSLMEILKSLGLTLVNGEVVDASSVPGDGH